VHLYVQDSFKPFPTERRGQYDVVNLRSALCYVKNEDAEPLLRNMISLLSTFYLSFLFILFCFAFWIVEADGGKSLVDISSVLSPMRTPRNARHSDPPQH
jgi:hypothetical protein